MKAIDLQEGDRIEIYGQKGVVSKKLRSKGESWFTITLDNGIQMIQPAAFLKKIPGDISDAKT